MRQAGPDATLEHMLKMNRPLTVETYLAMEYLDGAPPMTSELWEEIPEMLRIGVSQDSLQLGTESETETDGARMGALRLLKARHQSPAFMAQTRELSQSRKNTPQMHASLKRMKTRHTRPT